MDEAAAEIQQRAITIFAAIQGAQLVTRGRGDISAYDTILAACRTRDWSHEIGFAKLSIRNACVPYPNTTTKAYRQTIWQLQMLRAFRKDVVFSKNIFMCSPHITSIFL